MRLYDFIVENSSHCSTWNQDQVYYWISFFEKKGWVSIVEEEGEITGFGLVRPISDERLVNDHFYSDESGNGIFVDLVICKTPYARLVLGYDMLRKFKDKAKIFFKRCGKEGGTRCYNNKKLMKRWSN